MTLTLIQQFYGGAAAPAASSELPGGGVLRQLSHTVLPADTQPLQLPLPGVIPAGGIVQVSHNGLTLSRHTHYRTPLRSNVSWFELTAEAPAVAPDDKIEILVQLQPLNA